MIRSMKKDLRGFAIGATDGDIGTVDEFYFDDASFTVRHLVIDTGGWLTGRKVLISPMALRDIDWDAKRIKAALTKAQVEKSPKIDTDRPVSRQHEIAYYGYPYYWAGPYLWGAYPSPYPVPPSDRKTSLEKERRWDWAGESGDPHLRSSAAVIGYHIAAADGRYRTCRGFSGGRRDVVDSPHGRGHARLVVRHEGAGVVGLDHQRRLERVRAARRFDARGDQEQVGVRSIMFRAPRLRGATARSLWPFGRVIGNSGGTRRH